MGHASFPCPICKSSLRKASFLHARGELDPEIEKERRVRQNILGIYNKRLKDFRNLRQYNDYLEEVEDIIYNLSNDIDVGITQDKIKKYREQNQELIVRNKAIIAEERRSLDFKIKEEEIEQRNKRDQHAQEEMEQQQKLKAKQQEKDAILDDLAAGRISASNMKDAEKKMAGRDQMETSAAPTAPVAGPMQPTLNKKDKYSYVPVAPMQQFGLPQPVNGKPAPPMANPDGSMVLPQPVGQSHAMSISSMVNLTPQQLAKQQKAGGFREDLIAKRCIEEAFKSLLAF
eukprot:TRINITY_DN7323_c0_g1_i1.p1 TRINITY_DN7323_c0_g1~~TRINITY_DN7323_c0_g1_i1.p1  ORF type:complete len:327 (-),score=95.56 TRINITY_DN7323_c0_g1_i1:50-910(-)